jgi:hypothetical protein
MVVLSMAVAVAVALLAKTLAMQHVQPEITDPIAVVTMNARRSMPFRQR